MALSGPFIFVVEDDRDIRENLLILLRAEGYHASGAANGQDALDALRAADPLPDLILLDLMMPVKDGYAFRDEQLQDPQIAGIPILIMTASAQIDASRARMGVEDSIRKPLELDPLLAAISRNLLPRDSVR